MLWTIAVMGVLNVLMVLLTLGVKMSRTVKQRGLEARAATLEAALDESLLTGRADPELLNLKGRDMDLLAARLIEYLTLLTGSQRERLIELAREAGLVRRFFWRLRSRNRWRKAQAAEGLGYLGGPEAVPQITQLLSYEDETVRAVAARALARIGTPEAAASLSQTLNDPSELTRLRMAENLERIGAVATASLVETLDAGNPRARVLAARVLGNLRAADARPALRETLTGPDDEVPIDLKAQATLALGKIGDPEDVPVLVKASESEEWPVRAQAANALERIGEASTIPALRRLTLDQEWWVRLNASRALSNMGPAGEAALVSVLEGEDRFARDRAASSLEARGVIRRAAEALDQPGERGENARRMIRAMTRAGATRYLGRLAETMPEGETRLELNRILNGQGEGAEQGPTVPPPDVTTETPDGLPGPDLPRLDRRPAAETSEVGDVVSLQKALPGKAGPSTPHPGGSSGSSLVVRENTPLVAVSGGAARDVVQTDVRRTPESVERGKKRIVVSVIAVSITAMSVVALSGGLRRRAKQAYAHIRESLIKVRP
ncbi:HEAT repeat domain-containing protein [Rubrobacter tropicus]|nr:HEAT repeat domain-containing protein [Rubrobacter tropicus]